MLTKPKSRPTVTPTVTVRPSKISKESLGEEAVVLAYKTYFGEHNGKNIRIREGINYIENQLVYSLTRYEAKSIAQEISELCPLEKWNFIDFGSFFGVLALSILDLPQVANGYLEENKYRDILEKNMEQYGNWNRVIIQDRFDQIPKTVMGQIGIIQLDPQKVDYEDPENSKVQGMTLQELVNRLYGIVSLLVIIVPKSLDYVFKGMKFKLLGDKKHPSNFKVGYLVSPKGIEIAVNLGLKFKASEEQAKGEWSIELQKYLVNLLKKLGITDAKNYIAEQYMPIWIKCFTHESKDTSPKKIENYQELETVGDFILKGLFVKYLWNQTKNTTSLNKEQITLIQQNYMSAHFQPRLADDLGLPKYLRVDRMTDDRKEDIFEAFVAAYFDVSDSVGGVGTGYINIMNLLKYLFEDVEKIDFNVVKETELNLSSMQIKLLLEKLHFKHNEKTYPSSDSVYVEVRIPPLAVDYLRTRGFNLGPVIGKGSAPAKNTRAASKSAYDDAVNNLTKAGFTMEWAMAEKARLETLDPDIAEFEDQILKKRKIQGLWSIYFVENPASCTTYLYGVDNQYNHFILAEMSGCNFKEAKRRLIVEWLKS